MTIEEIRIFLTETGLGELTVQRVIDGIVAIRSAAYNEGWNDGIEQYPFRSVPT